MIPSNTGLILCVEQKGAETEYDSLLLSSHHMLTLVWPQDLVKVFKGDTKVPIHGRNPQILSFPLTGLVVFF